MKKVTQFLRTYVLKLNYLPFSSMKKACMLQEKNFTETLIMLNCYHAASTSEGSYNNVRCILAL